jgi:hypothetical protein
MNLDTFGTWAKSVGISNDAASLLAALLPKETDFLGVPDRVHPLRELRERNFPCDIPILDSDVCQRGYLIIGLCPNGDPVLVGVREPDLPVYYGEYGRLYSGRLTDGIKKVSVSLRSFIHDINSSQVSMARDFWDIK